MFFCTVLPASAAGAKTAATVSASARRSANQEPLLKITSPSRAALSRAASNIRRPPNPGPGHCSPDTRRANGSTTQVLGEQRRERVARDQEAALDELLGSFEAPVLVLDGHNVVVADGVQRRDEPRPVHLAEPGDARYLPADPARQRAVTVEALAPDLEILRVRVEDPLREVVNRPLVVDHQPHQVRRVEIEPEVRVRDRGEHLVPD